MRGIVDEFPNPVLTEEGEDYIPECSFETALDYESDKNMPDTMIIGASYTLNCDELQSYIDQGAATVAVQVRSSAASYSELLEFGEGSTKRMLEIPRYKAAKKLRITGLIIAARDIPDFACPNEFNSDFFESQTFDIRRGDILAYENDHVLRIDDTELGKPLSSIFYIERKADQADDVKAHFDDYRNGKILITLKPELHDLYCYFTQGGNSQLISLANANIVYPVLIEALAIMQKTSVEDEGHSQQIWYRSIESKLTESEIANLHDIEREGFLVPLADRLLGHASLGSLSGCKQKLEEPRQGEDEDELGDEL